MPSPSPKDTWEKQFTQKSESDISSENGDFDKENKPPKLENNGHHCHLKSVSESLTQQRNCVTRTPGKMYPGIARSINTATKGELSQNWNKIGYKKTTKKRQYDTKYALKAMQNQSAAADRHSYHPHTDIRTSRALQNPAIHAELNLALLSITSPDAWITEFDFDTNIPMSYFAKIYLPHATLTAYKDSALRTAKGHAYTLIPGTNKYLISLLSMCWILKVTCLMSTMSNCHHVLQTSLQHSLTYQPPSKLQDQQPWNHDQH